MILEKKVLFEGTLTKREVSIIHLALYCSAVDKMDLPEDVVRDMQNLLHNLEVLEPELQIYEPIP